MRFDDRIATALGQPVGEPASRAARWRQLVDLLAQRRGEGEGEAASHAYAVLRTDRQSVEPALRRRVAESLSGLAVDPEMVVFFAEDDAAIAAPLISGARLSAGDWRAILPRLGPTGRALLRHRRDLDPDVARALAAFGAADFVIEGRVVADGESQIRALVDRIEAYRRQKGEGMAAATAARTPLPVAESFRWETGTDGVIRWIEGAPREAILGQSIARIAGPATHGVDGQAAGAFEKRAPFRDARLVVPGQGPAAGDWRISGVPVFDPARGAFTGYRGAARRPRLDQVARPPSGGAGLFGDSFPADAVRQLIHELRTPLNAITGFAELIEGQYMGPAATPYRARAGRIIGEAHDLLSAIDDLDTAARIETSRLELDPAAVDVAAVVGRLHQSYARLAAQRSAGLTLEIAPGLSPAAVDSAAAERMLGRLFAATIGLAGPGETLRATLAAAAGGARLSLAIDRPQAIAGLGEAALLDPGYTPQGDWPDAPALGLGFALRLVRNLAEAAGGALSIGVERIRLDLPAARPDETVQAR